MAPLLSIVIPTRNRYKYLYKLVELIDSFHSDEIEICISDNSDDNTDFLNFLRDKGYQDKVVYKHYTERLSQSENSDKAILMSCGEYVCFIGDDDGVLPEIVNVTRKLKMMGAEAILANNPTYNWPDFYDPKFKSMLFYNEPTGNIKRLEAKNELESVISHGFITLECMPQVYHGIVKRSVLDKLYKRLGTYSPGGSPDIATAAALSLIVKELFYIDMPIIISGQSIHVGGGERALHGNLPKIGDVPYLPHTIVQDWNPRIPDVWCSDTIWPQSAIYALTLMDYPGVNNVDYDNLLAIFFNNHSRYYHQYKHLAENITRVKILIYYKKIRGFARKIKIGLRAIFKGGDKYDGRITKNMLNNINEAASFLSNISKEIVI